METKRTNKELLVKGLKKMGISLICMFLGPSLLHIGFTNPEKPLYIPILIVAFTICCLAVFFAYKGLKTIMDSMFN
ncbi:membrane protein [Mangrovimonas yunxiaonensis]|uniref:Membrane protein n=1 Tax=Mangrovimonas yunxiaonensis TaxID=1197477 RepID=A0A084TN98_9FLAO|nr:DUF6095 family protein [Mangrovimonas yunxiaonensis]KFB02184.1 membrane protein [Mangrovimonas yunxiaonensis]GGH47431.1 membrane protein [Mangrovimonas yunxiaonensis]